MSLQQLIDWTEKVSQSLKEAGRTRVCIPTVFTAAPAVLKKFQETPYAETLKGNGSYYFLYLPVNVYEQSSQREDAGHYFQQQAADLHQRKILYRC